jgi:ribosomal-protein-alanine N-acetyltransferase
MSDRRDWRRIREHNARWLARWEATRPPGDLQQPVTFRQMVRDLRRTGREGRGLPLALLVDGAFAGQVVIGNVVREPLLSAYVGYWIGAHVAGGGAATAAVALAVDHCFSRVGLHRIEATVRPENVRSLRVLAKLGFREEGLLRRYLEVDGDWRDHLVLAVTEEDVLPDGLVGRLLRAGRAERA